MRFPDYHLLEILVGLSPLLHQHPVLVELVDEPLDDLVLEGQFLEEQMLRQRVHDNSFLHAAIKVIDDQFERFIVATDDCRCPAVGER